MNGKLYRVSRILNVLLFRNLLLRLVNDEIRFCRVHSRVSSLGELLLALVRSLCQVLGGGQRQKDECDGYGRVRSIGRWEIPVGWVGNCRRQTDFFRMKVDGSFQYLTITSAPSTYISSDHTPTSSVIQIDL